MSSNPESGGNAEPLGVRRPVELPEVDTESADDLAPASDARPETEGGRPETGPAADSGETGATAEAAGESGPDDATATATATEKDEQQAQTRGIAGVTPAVAGAGDGPPPDRPKKPVLAGVAIGGVVLLAVPLLLIGTGSHHDKKHPTVAAADTVLPGDARQQPGAYTSASPTSTPSPSASASKKAKPKPAKSRAAGKHAAAAAKAGFTGVADVLLKNAATGMCADVPGYGNGSADGPVNQFHCALGDADNQVWALGVMQGLKGPGSAPLFEIRNTKDDLCMDLPMFAGQKAGTKVAEYYCRPTKADNQLWYRQHTTGSRYRIRNYASHGLCLGVTGRSGAGADSRLEIHACGSGDEWTLPNGG